MRSTTAALAVLCLGIVALTTPSQLLAETEPESRCCGLDRTLLRQGGWSIPEVSLATTHEEPRSTESAVVSGVPLTIRTYPGTGTPYRLPLDAVDTVSPANESDAGGDLRSTALVRVYSAKGRPFCLFLYIKDEPEPGCTECGVSCAAFLALYDNDGDGLFETLEPADRVPPQWVPTLPEWLRSPVAEPRTARP